MSQHSILSPSSAHRRVRCIGALAACKGIPNTNSKYAAEGTAYHFVASEALSQGRSCYEWVGFTVAVLKNGNAVLQRDPPDMEFQFIIDEENAAHAQTYVDAIRRIPGNLNVEVRIDTSTVVGVEGQGGTGDAVVLDYDNLTIHVDDLKFGMGEVVYADGNEQLLEYGAGALDMFDMLAPWKYIKLGIHMPRLRFYDEKVYTVEEVRAWVAKIQPLEQKAFDLYQNGRPPEIRAAMTPSPKACRWCPLSGKCPAQSDSMANMFSVAQAAPAVVTMTDEQLNDARIQVDEMERYISAVKEQIYQRALSGASFADWELVEGKKGNRAWKDAHMAAITLEIAVGEEAYKPKEIISPADADKLLNKKRHPEAEKRQLAWVDLVGEIHQAPAGKSLVRRGTPNKTPATVQRVEFGLGGGT